MLLISMNVGHGITPGAMTRDPEVVTSQPFWPAYPTAERIAKAQQLKLAITAGICSLLQPQNDQVSVEL
jgi:hypothetical protein